MVWQFELASQIFTDEYRTLEAELPNASATVRARALFMIGCDPFLQEPLQDARLRAQPKRIMVCNRKGKRLSGCAVMASPPTRRRPGEEGPFARRCRNNDP